MGTLSAFATEAHPLRCSSLPLLVACPLRAVMLYMNEALDNAGKAADTGSAVHKAIATWHTNGQNYKDALEAMHAAVAEFPLADFSDAELHFRPYTKDPRNIEAELLAVETPVRFTLSPSPLDPTQEVIHVRGTLDQIRYRDGTYYLDDVKTGKRTDGYAMLHHYAMQIAAYAIGATQRFERPVYPGAIIRTYGYRVRGAPKPETQPGGVFFNYALDLEQANALLDAVRTRVALIRAGLLEAGPGDHCSYCPANGLDNCAPQLQQLRLR